MLGDGSDGEEEDAVKEEEQEAEQDRDGDEGRAPDLGVQVGDGGGQGYPRQSLKSLALLASLADCDESWERDSGKEIVVSHNWDEIRHITWDYVGIVRTTKRLERIRNRVQIVASEIVDYCRKFLVSNNLLELRNLAIVANLKFPVGPRMQEITGHPLHLGLPKNQRQIGPDRPYPGSRDLR